MLSRFRRKDPQRKRKLAERALEKLAPWFPSLGAPWTAETPLPGGDVPNGDMARYATALQSLYPGLPPAVLGALARRHGSRAHDVLGAARHPADLGEFLGRISTRARSIISWRTNGRAKRQTCSGAEAKPVYISRTRNRRK